VVSVLIAVLCDSLAQLILPFLDLKIEYYDLGLENRDATNDGAPRTTLLVGPMSASADE
jgi:hypothetical protein